jgi:hypothetical protein
MFHSDTGHAKCFHEKIIIRTYILPPYFFIIGLAIWVMCEFHLIYFLENYYIFYY